MQALRYQAVAILASASAVGATWGWGIGTSSNSIQPDPSDDPSAHQFTLRHVFHQGLYDYPQLSLRVDVPPEQVRASRLKKRSLDDLADAGSDIGPYTVRSTNTKIERLARRSISDVEPLLETARLQGHPPALPDSAWSLEDVPTPNVTDRDTIINFALMAANAYDQDRSRSEWEEARAPFNLSSSYGWKGDGLRGHVFADATNSTVVVSMKGTTPAVFDGAETTTNDKVNDNLFFSCCCGQGGQYLWLKVCDCMKSAFLCNETCVVQSLKKKNRYYHASIELYGNITELYPDATIWLAGHSLGGSVASLLGLTFGLPVITFEAPGDALPAQRLGLPSPPSARRRGLHQTRQYTGAYHFGHTADPIFMGTCNSAYSACTLGFYAMESTCHTGHRCVWDTVGDLKWRVSAQTHSIRGCLRDVYRAYDTLPKCELDTECVDCGAWNYFHSNGSDGKSSTSSTSTSTTSTRTETCKTPGWWGCLDSSTTTTTSTTSTTTSTATITTTTCAKYGWFGNCLDPITTTITTTKTSPSPTSHTATVTTTKTSTSTSTCRTPGHLWGCKDQTTAPATPSATSSTLTASCSTPGYLWGCRDEQAMITHPPAVMREGL